MITIPTLRGSNIKAWPKNETGGAAPYLPISEVLTSHFKTDVHFAQYSNPEVARRLGKECLVAKHLETLGGTVRMVLAVFDVDGPRHAASPEWRQGERSKVAKLFEVHSGLFGYHTRHGYRLVALLPEPHPIATLEDAKHWTDFYLQSVAYLKRVFDIEADSVGDWQRLFRAPHATRDESGKPENLPTVGDPASIGTWQPDITQADIERAKFLGKKPPKTKPSRKTSESINYNGRGVIGRLLSDDGLLGNEVEPGCWNITCPFDKEHTTGEGGHGTTRYYEPASDGHYLGTIDCLHTGHGHNSKTSKEWLECWPQARIDAAREAEGLPKWKPPKAKATVVKREGAMPPVDFDELDDPNGPDGAPISEGGKVARYWGGPTDLGNAERLVAMFGENLRYCYPKKKWLIWCGTHWQWDDGGTVQRMTKEMVRSLYQVAIDCLDDDRRKLLFKWACDSEGNSRISAAIALAQSERGVPVKIEQLDADPWLFNVANGTIDLRTGKLRPHMREDLCTRISDTTYNPKARSDLWDRFFATAIDNDSSLGTYLQRACGYALLGSVLLKKFWMLYGVPDASKSCFIGAIAQTFGGYHETADASTWLVQNNVGGNRGDMVRLHGARLVTSVEFPENAKFDEALIKKITGRDALTFAAKYEAEISFTAAFALWLACNDAPRIRDTDAGMWARAQRVPFNHVIPKEEQDERLLEKLDAPEVRSAILAWCVQGCLDWQREGLNECQAIVESVKAYRAENDRAETFIRDCLEFFEGYRCSAGELRTAYDSWCKENGIKSPLTGNELGQRLQDRGAIPGKSNGVRYWKGVRLASAADETQADVIDRQEYEAEYSWRDRGDS